MNKRQLFIDTFKVVSDNQQRFVQALAIPFLMLVALDLTELVDVPAPLGPVIGILGILIYTNFAIVTHRLVILGNDSVPRYGLKSVSQREWTFMGYLIGITAGLAVPLGLIAYILRDTAVVLVTVFAAVVYLYMLARLSLVFPGTAIDKWVTIPRAWSMTRCHQSSMFIVVILFPMLLGVAIMLPVTFLGSLLPHAVMVALYSLVNTFLLIFTITILSLAYKEISGLEAKS